MANRTIKDAKTVHGTNPQYLIEKIIRTRVYESRYWKEECFALNAELIVDKGIELRFIGGIYGGNIKPTPFMCLLLKMLQIQPYKDIVIEFIRQEDFKYVRALGAFYLRLTGTSLEVWKYLEPLYNDYRKLRKMDRMGNFSIMHMDEFIDALLREDRVFDVILPRISKRSVHEEASDLEPRISVLEEDINNVESEEEEVSANIEREVERHRTHSPKRQRSKSPKRTSRSRSRSRSPGHKKSSRSQSDKRKRDRSDSRDHRRRSRSPRRNKERDREEEKKKEKKEKKKEKPKDPAEMSEKEAAKALANEIKQANALRAKLGLKPLKP